MHVIKTFSKTEVHHSHEGFHFQEFRILHPLPFSINVGISLSNSSLWVSGFSQQAIAQLLGSLSEKTRYIVLLCTDVNHFTLRL